MWMSKNKIVSESLSKWMSYTPTETKVPATHRPNPLTWIMFRCCQTLLRKFSISTVILGFICRRISSPGKAQYRQFAICMRISSLKCMFSLFHRNPVDGKSEKVAFYNIFCHDPDLIDYVKNNLQKRDRVFLNGFLNSKPDIDENGKKVFSGFIEATNIMKIDRFLELSSENRMRTSGDEWN